MFHLVFSLKNLYRLFSHSSCHLTALYLPSLVFEIGLLIELHIPRPTLNLKSLLRPTKTQMLKISSQVRSLQARNLPLIASALKLPPKIYTLRASRSLVVGLLTELLIPRPTLSLKSLLRSTKNQMLKISFQVKSLQARNLPLIASAQRHPPRMCTLRASRSLVVGLPTKLHIPRPTLSLKSLLRLTKNQRLKNQMLKISFQVRSLQARNLPLIASAQRHPPRMCTLRASRSLVTKGSKGSSNRRCSKAQKSCGVGDAGFLLEFLYVQNFR